MLEQQEEFEKSASDRKRSARDAEIARKLELEEEMESKNRLLEQELAHSQMKMTPEGRAWQFVNELLVEFEKFQARNVSVPIQPVAKDDLYFMTLNLLKKQDVFFASNFDAAVDIG
jgi:hypothetical protein